MRRSGRQSSLGGVLITGICLVRYGKPRPCRTNPSRRPWRYGRGRGCRTNSLLPRRTVTRGLVWYGGDRFSVPNRLYRCRASVLLPRCADFPRRSVRCGGILRDKLRETPVSHCATIRVLFLMLVLSAGE